MAEGRGWGLGKNNRVGIVVVGLIGNWVTEIIQNLNLSASQLDLFPEAVSYS